MVVACMCVKNEEDYVEASIQSIYGLCDYIRVIDNGSTDRTLDILRGYDKVILTIDDRDWKDLGENVIRDELIHSVPEGTEYILIIDGDEVLWEGQDDRIRYYLEDTAVGAWHWKSIEFYGDHYHVQDQFRGEGLDPSNEVVPGFGKQVIHGRPMIYRYHKDLTHTPHSSMKYGIHNSIRGQERPQGTMICEDIIFAHYGSCKSNERIYNKTIFYYEADITIGAEHMEELRGMIDPDNPLGYHPDQAVRPFFGKHPAYMRDNPVIFHRITTGIDDEGKARITSRSDTPLDIPIHIGTPAECGRSDCNYDPPVIDVALKRASNEYTVIKALDYYTATTELCMIHPNVFVMVNENIPRNPQFAPGTLENIGLIHRNARHLIAVSESVRNALLAEGVPHERISVINFWGCDTEHWRPVMYTPEEVRAIKDDYNPTISDREVLFVGRLEHHKGIPYLLQTLPMIDASIVIVGPGDFDQFTRYIPTGYTNRVFYNGPMSRDRLLELYNIANILVLPSVPTTTWIEQFGRVLTEGMACCLPCIATDIGGPRDIIQNGVTGLLVRPADSGALASGINTILGDPDMALSMGIAGRLRCNTLFSDAVSQAAFDRCVRDNII